MHQDTLGTGTLSPLPDCVSRAVLPTGTIEQEETEFALLAAVVMSTPLAGRVAKWTDSIDRNMEHIKAGQAG